MEMEESLMQMWTRRESFSGLTMRTLTVIPHKKMVDLEDIVCFFARLSELMVYRAVYRKPYKIVRQTVCVCGNPLLLPLSDLASLPLGALRRAQRTLARAQVEGNPSDSEDESSESQSEPEKVPAKGKERKPNAHKPEWSNKPRTDIAKRPNKNA
jgi:hypothetical protein